MACTIVTITPILPSALTVVADTAATLAVSPTTPISTSAAPVKQAELTVAPAGKVVLSVNPIRRAVLTIGEVCSVSSGTIVVLAAKDGPLRTRDGGYFLLNPATN